MTQPVDPATLGDGPILIVSAGESGGYYRVFVDVTDGPVHAATVSRILGSRWDWPAGRQLPGLPSWHRVSPHLLWRTGDRRPAEVSLAPTSTRVAALVEELARDNAPFPTSMVGIADWTDENVDRLAALLQKARRFSPDLTTPPWLLSFDGGDDAEVNLREIEYELGERPPPHGELSFGVGPWMVHSVGYQGDVHAIDVIWGEAHRHSIAGSIRRCWGSGSGVLELRGHWWDVEEDGRISIMADGEPFHVGLLKISPAVATAVTAYEPYHCCSPGVFDLPRWPDDQALRCAAALHALPVRTSSLVKSSVLSHAGQLAYPDQLAEALEALAGPTERPVDAGSTCDLGLIWTALNELLDGTGVRTVVIADAGITVELAGGEGPAQYRHHEAGPFHLLLYRHERRDRGSFPVRAVDAAELARFVSAASAPNRDVHMVELSAVGETFASVVVRYRDGNEDAVLRGRIELPSGRIVPERL